METQTFKMYMVVGTGTYNHGTVSLTCYKPCEDKPDDSFGSRLLRELDVDADVPAYDLVTLELESLEKCIQRERADSQVKVNILLDRISKLKAIGHEVAADDVVLAAFGMDRSDLQESVDA